MKLETYPNCHLTYCSNIHPGEEWYDHFKQLKLYLPELKKRISPDRPFGVGLRLSAKAASELLKSENLQQFSEWLEKENLYLFTINGFPYGSFHGERVKDSVYSPDWANRDRLEYTLNLINILAFLLPEGEDGGISTSPVSYKYWHEDDSHYSEIFHSAAVHFAETAHEMNLIHKNFSKELHIDIEPEPDCLLENSSETISFFRDWLLPNGGSHLTDVHGYSKDESQEILKRHIRVCYDTCHFALEYEEPGEALSKLSDAGIRIGKTQISSALKIKWDEKVNSVDRILAKLKQFDEPVYLHQVIELRRDSSYKQYRDLPAALSQFDVTAAKEWRIHFHVPVFVEQFDELDSTQDHIRQGLRLLLEKSDCRHFEIETYTWEVLPKKLKADLADSIEREFKWTLDLIESYKTL